MYMGTARFSKCYLLTILILVHCPGCAPKQVVTRGDANQIKNSQLIVLNEQEERPIDQKLFTAVRDGNAKAVENLLTKGANANAIEANGWTPLISADTPGPKVNLAIVRLLLAKGAKVNYKQPDQGWTPLMHFIAFASSNEEVVKFLLDS